MVIVTDASQVRMNHPRGYPPVFVSEDSSSWEGADAHEFTSRWIGTHAPTLRRVADRPHGPMVPVALPAITERIAFPMYAHADDLLGSPGPRGRRAADG